MAVNDRQNRLSVYKAMRKDLAAYSEHEIESGVMLYYLDRLGISHQEAENARVLDVSKFLDSHDFPADLESVIDFFETLFDQQNKDENGIVFTPRYIADYIVSTVFANIAQNRNDYSIIDPCCGCGIFLVTAAEYLHNMLHIDIDTIIENNIYGIDLDPANARRCDLVLRLLSATHGGNFESIKTNIICKDSLSGKWGRWFKIKKFDYIISNPPYVNPHDMSKDTAVFLRKHFKTTQSGTFNIFYAFIEHSLKHLGANGKLGFIVPNNFLSIKSALDLRTLLQKGKYVEKILDFGDNMIFRPVKTYNCILVLGNGKRNSVEYSVMPTTRDIESALKKLGYRQMDSHHLDKNGWKLVSDKTHDNLKKIEAQKIRIKDFIRTGIATLRDKIYLVSRDDHGYYKMIDDDKFYIEPGLVKPIYKVPDLKLHDSIDDVVRYIIFPYVKGASGYSLIEEKEFLKDYPRTYGYLQLQRKELDRRDKGKENPQGWYAYGRTQGLNKHGKKLLFPTFSDRPRFIYVDNEDALFCNGFAVFENDKIALPLLQKVLNSSVMEYYVKNTSYTIRGGYYCYQKKYIEKFSIPSMSEEEKDTVNRLEGDELDRYLWGLYQLQ